MYKYETHLHTSESSACARSTGAEMARAIKKAGYAGAIITDHFFNGNCAIRGNHSWRERIRLFMRGYENAKREGDKIGLDIYFGFEYAMHGTEFLIYNFNEEQLVAYPEIMRDSFEKASDRIRSEGGFIIHAHPFREEPYVQQPGRIFPESTDAVEALNIMQPPESNNKAWEYAESYNLIKVGGSDAHSTESVKGGVSFAQNPASLEELISMIKQNRHTVLGG